MSVCLFVCVFWLNKTVLCDLIWRGELVLSPACYHFVCVCVCVSLLMQNWNILSLSISSRLCSEIICPQLQERGERIHTHTHTQKVIGPLCSLWCTASRLGPCELLMCGCVFVHSLYFAYGFTALSNQPKYMTSSSCNAHRLPTPPSHTTPALNLHLLPLSLTAHILFTASLLLTSCSHACLLVTGRLFLLCHIQPYDWLIKCWKVV